MFMSKKQTHFLNQISLLIYYSFLNLLLVFPLNFLIGVHRLFLKWPYTSNLVRSLHWTKQPI